MCAGSHPPPRDADEAQAVAEAIARREAPLSGALQPLPFAAARLAGIPKTLFLSRLADYGIDTFRLTEGELERQKSLA